MANWGDILHFISSQKTVDDDGFEIDEPGAKRKVFANKKSIRSQEFHMAKQEGVTLSYMFEVRTLEYDGQDTLMYNGKEYNIYRTYEKGEFIELICQRESVNHGD